MEDNNGVELEIGDTVRLTGEVKGFRACGLIASVSLERGQVEVYTDLVEFVSRPEPTVSVELTLAELLCLRTEYAPADLHDKIYAARKELRNG